MNGTVTMERCALVLDAFSLYRTHAPRRIDYKIVVEKLRESSKLTHVIAHCNYFDAWFQTMLENMGVQTKSRTDGYVFDLVKDTLELCKFYRTIFVFTEDHYIAYLKEEASKMNSDIIHIGNHGDIPVLEEYYRCK